jgi:hypothetical protein
VVEVRTLHSLRQIPPLRVVASLPLASMVLLLAAAPLAMSAPVAVDLRIRRLQVLLQARLQALLQGLPDLHNQQLHLLQQAQSAVRQLH